MNLLEWFKSLVRETGQDAMYKNHVKDIAATGILTGSLIAEAALQVWPNFLSGFEYDFPTIGVVAAFALLLTLISVLGYHYKRTGQRVATKATSIGVYMGMLAIGAIMAPTIILTALAMFWLVVFARETKQKRYDLAVWVFIIILAIIKIISWI